MAILVTGGTGYIGSHTVLELLNAGYDVVALDNLSNSSKKSLQRVNELAGKEAKFYEADIRDEDGLRNIFEKENIDSIIEARRVKEELLQTKLEYVATLEQLEKQIMQ